MSLKVCPNGHTFEKTSDCPVCPTCSKKEMEKKYSEFPKISAPAMRALDSVGIETLKDLTKFTEKELLNLHGMGPKAFGILKKEMEMRGFSFRTI